MKRSTRSLLCLLQALFWLLVGCQRTPAPTVTPSSLPPAQTASLAPTAEPSVVPPSPETTAAAFLGAWRVGDYDAMYTYLTPASQVRYNADTFAEWYRNAEIAAAVLTVTTRLQSGLQQGDAASIAYRLTLETALAGTLVTDTIMSLSIHDGQWRVDWGPRLIWPQLADDRYFYMDRTTPVRANIYDHDGLGLAVAGTIVTMGVIPGEIEDETALLAALAQVTGLEENEIQAKYAGAPANWRVPIADVPGEVSVQHNELLASTAGIYRDEKEGRYYPQGGVGPHVVGWVSPLPAEQLEAYRARGYRGDEWVGISGLEAWGEEILAGRPGGTLMIVNSAGEVLHVLAEVDAVRSRPIHTTFSRGFQRQVQDILGDRRGAIVVLDAKTGAILALASGPGFDTNVFVGGSGATGRSQILANPANPLFNRATQGTYPSASVFKIVTMAAALEEGGMDPQDTVFHCPGYWEGLGASYRKGCWKEDGHGDINLEDGLTASCDVVFYAVGQHLDEVGVDVLPRFARAFGFGQETGLVGVNEDAGLVPDSDWKVNTVGEVWWVGDTINLSIGQGYLLVNPLQVARMIAAVGNGGTLYRPYVIQQIGSQGDAERTSPQVVGTLPVSPEHLSAIQEALAGVTTRAIGTAPHRFTGLSIPVAGKTGTAEVGGPASIPHSWFAAYAPADDPEIAIAVIVERAGEGSTVAAPITRQVVEAYYGLALTPLPPQAQEGYETPTPEPTQ